MHFLYINTVQQKKPHIEMSGYKTESIFDSRHHISISRRFSLDLLVEITISSQDGSVCSDVCVLLCLL